MMSIGSYKRVAAVTGASSGIGAVYADRLARNGYDLIVVARRADRLQALSERLLAKYGTEVEVIAADLSDSPTVARVAGYLASNPRLDLLVNNAGLARLRDFASSNLQDAIDQISVNVTALTRLTHAVLPGLIERDRGTIINIASVLGVHVTPVSSVYSATKSFVINFSRGLQQELNGTNVRLQLVLPAATATEVWDNSGIPLDALDQGTVMSANDLVDAALAGLALGEDVTWPSVADLTLWDDYETATLALYEASRTSSPAPRYAILETTDSGI